MNNSSAADFDFLVGQWQVQHRRLRQRLTGSQQWQEFAGSCVAQSVLGGLGSFDDNLLELPEGTYRATSLRTFDARTQQWAIWWLDSRNPHSLDVPVIGAFVDGVGTFYADDSLDGKPIRVRFRWTDTHTQAPLWEQAFSDDDGKTWESNWEMRFQRVADS